MPSLSRIFTPERPEGLASHLEEGFIIGWVPGEITSVDDPEKLGRIRVRCDLIQQDTDLPNANDGWVWVLEEFVANAVPGGTHRLLKVGTQVALLPMMGDPRQMILLGCIPSRVDRPWPEMDRAKEVYGSATPGQVFEIKNDADASQLNAFPHGVLQHVSGKGDITQQTAQNARLQLLQDGTSRIENDKAFTTHAPDGTVVQRNAEGAQSILKADGKVELKSSAIASLLLDGVEAKLEGPVNQISQALTKARSFLGGHLNFGRKLLKQASGIAGDFVLGSDIEEFISRADSVLGKLQTGLGKYLPQGLEQLATLQTFSPQLLGAALFPQMGAVSAIATLVPQVEKILQQPTNIGAIANQVKALLPADLAKGFDLEKITPLLAGLSHDSDMQLQAVLGAIAPGGFSAIQNIVGLDLHKNLDQIQSLLNLDFPEPESDRQQVIQQRVRELRKLLPAPQQKLLSDETLRSVLTMPKDDFDSPLETLVGYMSRGLVGQAVTQLEAASPWVGAIGPLAELSQSLIKGGDVGAALKKLAGHGFQDLINAQASNLAEHAAKEVLPQAIAKLSKQLSPALQQGQSSLNQVVNAIPSKGQSPVVRATQATAEMAADATGKGAIARISKLSAEMLGPSLGGKRSGIFAGLGGAGIKTPFGKLSLGGKGGNLFMQGPLAMRVAQSVGRSVGLRLDPKQGVALSSFFDGSWSADNDDPDWGNESARIAVDEQFVRVQSLDTKGGVSHELMVGPNGIFVDGFLLKDLLERLDRLIAIEARLTAIEESLEPDSDPNFEPAAFHLDGGIF